MVQLVSDARNWQPCAFVCLPWHFFRLPPFLRSFPGGEVQYDPRTKLTVRSKVTSLMRPGTSLGTEHMLLRQAKPLELGRDNIKKSVKRRLLEHTLKNKNKNRKTENKQLRKPEVGSHMIKLREGTTCRISRGLEVSGHNWSHRNKLQTVPQDIKPAWRDGL